MTVQDSRARCRGRGGAHIEEGETRYGARAATAWADRRKASQMTDTKQAPSPLSDDQLQE